MNGNGTIGALALYLLFAWLISAAAGAWLTERKGYGERAGLMLGLILTGVGLLVAVPLPARPGAAWWRESTPYLRGAPVGFGRAIRLQVENISSYNGRASRSAYWWYQLGVYFIFAVCAVIGLAARSLLLFELLSLVPAVLGLGGLSLAVRRLHDSDRSGWVLLLGLIPVAGGIITLILMLLPSTPEPNRFG